MPVSWVSYLFTAIVMLIIALIGMVISAITKSHTVWKWTHLIILIEVVYLLATLPINP